MKLLPYLLVFFANLVSLYPFTLAYSQPLLDDGNIRSVTHVLEDLTSGPLRDKPITLILEQGTMLGDFEQEYMLGNINTPLFLLRLPSQPPRDLIGLHNSSKDGHQISLKEVDTPSFTIPPSVVIIVMTSDDPSWWPLWTPPENWIVKELVVIILSSSCSKDRFMKTPLLQKPSSLALLCQSFSRARTVSGISFRIWSWMPYGGHNGTLVQLGTWDRSFKDWHHLFADRFSDMKSKTLDVICSVEDSPLVYRTTSGLVTGVSYFIIEQLSKWLKFSANFRAEDFLSWADTERAVVMGESDAFINYATITPERYSQMDFSVPYHREGFGIILELPPPLPRWQSVLFPFSWTVWALTGLSFLSTAVLYHLINYKQETSLVTNTITVLKSLLSNPLAVVPERWFVRNFLLLWWIMSWFIDMSYTCNLIAVLTAPVFPKKIQTTKDLAESNYRLCMLDYGEFVDEALAASTDPVLSALSEVLDMVPTDSSMEHIGEEQCVELAMAGTHAHTETISYLEILFNKMGHGPRVYTMEEQLYPGYLAILMAKHTPWKYKFDDGIQRMLEAGLIQKWYKDCMNDFKGYFQREQAAETQPLSLSHLQGPFLVYGIGLFISLISMICEVLFPSTENINGAVLAMSPNQDTLPGGSSLIH